LLGINYSTAKLILRKYHKDGYVTQFYKEKEYQNVLDTGNNQHQLDLNDASAGKIDKSKPQAVSEQNGNISGF
jgi:hypothetical protein